MRPRQINLYIFQTLFKWLRRIPLSARTVLLVAIYVLAGLGLEEIATGFETGENITLWDPSAGLHFVLLLGFGLRYTPELLLIPLLDMLVVRPLGIPPFYALFSALAIVLSYSVASALLLHKLHIDPRLRRFRDVYRFAVVILVASLVESLLYITVLAQASSISWSEWGMQVLSEWAGDATGIAVVAPSLLLLLRVAPWAESQIALDRSAPPINLSWPKGQEVLELSTEITALAIAIWFAYGFPSATTLEYSYFVFVPLIWIAVRHGFERAVLAVLLTNVGVTLLVCLQSNVNDALALQFCLLTASYTGLLLGAVVSERNWVEGSLRESEQQYQNLYDSAPDVYFAIAADGTVGSINQVGADFLGYRKEELIGQPIWIVVDQADRQRVQQWLTRIFSEKLATSEIELRKVHKDGSVLWLRERSRLLFDEDGKPTGLHMICRDITEYKRAEETLRQTQQNYKELVDSIDGVVWEADAQTFQSLFVSQQAERLLGYPVECWLEEPTFWEDHLHVDDRKWAVGYCKELTAEKRDHEFEYRMIAADGRTVWLRDLVTVVVENDQPVKLRGVKVDVTAHKQAEEQLLHNAFHDTLTGLPNRALFMDRLGHALEHSKRHQDYLFAVLFLDLDRFKVINDSLGHSLGDQMLIVIASRLKEYLRSMDTAARLGGDEFTILLEDISDMSDAIRVAERIQEQLTSPFKLDGQEVFTTASIGIVFSATGYHQPEDLLRDADIAMYRAKTLGKARYEIFNSDMRDRAITRLQLETELRRAIEYQEFRVHYQPIVSLKTGKVIGFEALVRWQHPDRGLLYPAEFLSIAEETGLSISVDQWVLREACRQTQEWQARFPHGVVGNFSEAVQPLTVSVNLGSLQFRQPELLQHINRVLQETNLAATGLKLEITENAIMGNDESATVMLWQLKELGIQLSIDDFGTGYSSLGRLHRFPINMLKIDRCFINQIGKTPFGNGKNLEIIETIVTLAQKLGVDVTAEGIETAEQLARLRELNCNYGQGYFFSRPLDTEAAEALMMTRPQW